MKIEYLMIGDWVMRVDVEDPHPVMVTAVNGIKHYIRVLEPYTGRYDILLYAGSIEGIKTTMDVMEAFGFNYWQGGCSKYFGDVLCQVFLDRNGLKKITINDSHVAIFCEPDTQLHELQHILHCAGLELDGLQYVLHCAGLELEADAWAKQSTPQQLNTSTIDN